MKRLIFVATALILISLACGPSDEKIQRMIDEKLATTLAIVPTSLPAGSGDQVVITSGKYQGHRGVEIFAPAPW